MKLLARLSRFRPLGPVLAIALTVSLTVSGCCLPIPLDGGPARESSPDPGWTICTNDARTLLGRVPSGFEFQCKMVKVPQDWNKPDGGETLEISVIRARATDQRDRLGSLLINPGGPGGSGFDYAIYLTQVLPEEITSRFDIVGFDPRGVGRSGPIECFNPADLDASFGADPDPVSQPEFDAIVALTQRMVDGCGSKYGDRLAFYSTEQAARDIDQIRNDVGDEKLTYLGYSYGTLLGATYAQLFPAKVRALVLDGAVDPTVDSVQSSETQALGFERAFDNFSAWCAGNTTRCPIDGEARAVVTKLLEQAEANPLEYQDGRRATAGWIMWGVISSMYTKDYWPDLGKALDELGEGRPSGIFQLADSYADRDENGEYSNLFDANSAVNCADEESPATIDRIRALQSEWRLKYPLFGAPLAVSLMTCALWPGGHDPYPTGPATGAPPILVVGTKGDPATPYEQTPKLAAMLGAGVVLTWEGEGHTAYPQTRCITAAVNKYLIEVEPPAAGTSCPAS